MPFAPFAHFCGWIKPAARYISRPLVRRSATLIALGAALRGHLAAQQHGHADEEDDADYQRRSQRGEVGPHGGLLPSVSAPLPAGRAVSGATPMLIFPARLQPQQHAGVPECVGLYPLQVQKLRHALVIGAQ